MRNKGYFALDNTRSDLKCKLYTAGSGIFNSPERDIEKIEIPGRNGDLIVDNGRFKNVKVVFTVVLKDDFIANAARLKSWLLENPGYRKLSYSFVKDEYRMARFSGSVEWTIATLLRYGYADLEFDCKPQIFLISGDEEQSSQLNSWSVYNPTSFDSKPTITVEGSGSGKVTVDGNVITLSSIGGVTNIDSEMQECTGTSGNRSRYVSFSTGEFPKLKPGENIISKSGGVTKVIVKGKWWKV